MDVYLVTYKCPEDATYPIGVAVDLTLAKRIAETDIEQQLEWLEDQDETYFTSKEITDEDNEHITYIVQRLKLTES